MIRVARPFLILLVVLALGLAGVLRGPAMAGTTGLTEMVLCGGVDTQTVWIDAAGNPVDPMQDCAKCPDCIAGSLVGLPPSNSNSAPVATTRRRVSRPVALRRPCQRNLRPIARGPPFCTSGKREAAFAPFPKAAP